MEVWKPIEDFPGYSVSSEGRIKSDYVDRVIGTYDNGSGNLQVVMRQNGRPCARSVARLVATAFIDPMPPEYSTRHLNGDKYDNRAENLIWLPRPLAMKLARQDTRDVPMDYRPILMVATGEIYENALECAKAIHGLEELILLTAQRHDNAKYKGSEFEFYYG